MQLYFYCILTISPSLALIKQGQKMSSLKLPFLGPFNNKIMQSLLIGFHSNILSLQE